MTKNVKKISADIVAEKLHLKFLMAIIFGVLAVVILPFVTSTLEWAYYKYSPIESFVDYRSIIPDNMCAGDTEHVWHVVRFVHGTEVGWRAEVVNEFYLMGEKGEWTPLGNLDNNEGRGRTVLYERVPDGVQDILYRYKEPFAPGTYKNVSTVIRLYLPQDVVRESEINVEGTPFTVFDCNQTVPEVVS